MRNGEKHQLSNMTPEQYLAGLRILLTTQERFAKYAGFSVKTSNNYAKGHSRIPKWVADMMRRMVDFDGSLPAELRRKYLTPEEARAKRVQDMQDGQFDLAYERGRGRPKKSGM